MENLARRLRNPQQHWTCFGAILHTAPANVFLVCVRTVLYDDERQVLQKTELETW